MSIPPKVLWGKGYFMRAQHFQQQDHYHEARLHQMSKTMHPYTWGVRQLSWDLEALKANRLKLESLSLIFHDGDIYEAPRSEPLPPAIDLGALPPDVKEITYHAALPFWTGGGGNVARVGQPLEKTRYTQFDRGVPDLLTDGEAEAVSYLHKRVLLVSDHEPLGAYDCFPVIKLRRGVSGIFEADPAFIPPSLSIEASPALLTLLQQLMEALQAKVDVLKGNMREPSRNVIEFRAGDVSSFWLLHTAGTAAATLTHYVRHPGFHPERLYEALLGLAGSLMTYSKDYTLSGLPSYRHNDPGPCFARLDVVIRDLLDTVISTKCFAIVLEEKEVCYHNGKLDSGKIDQKTALYLAVSATMPARELVDVMPLRVKIGAPDDVQKCVLSALAGVKISHAPQVPAAIPVRPETYYFVLDNKSVLYEQMLKAQSISVYIPDGFRDLRVELLAVTE